MEFLSNLWMPILVSAVFVWISSFIMHMVVKHHRGDLTGLPNEEQAMEMLRTVKPGNYMFPFCQDGNWNSPEMTEKMNKGPMGVLTIFNGPTNMGANLMQMLLFYIVVGIFVAYIGSQALHGESEYLQKFRVCGSVAFCAHALGWMPFAIWFKNIRVFPYLLDSIVFTLITAGTFGWLWPK